MKINFSADEDINFVISTNYGEIEMNNFIQHIFIRQFTVKKEFRRKGYGYKLGKKLPKKCWLHPWPNHGSKMSVEQLKNFYRKLGFKMYWCEKRACHYAFKGFKPNKNFWDKI